ncbi:MAG: peroxiredoxin [Myxococcales bacterium]|nr:peroxiredoxin [Myxococcales bacterium]
MLQVGDPAPPFELESTSGGKLSLDSFRGKTLVLYFYPRDFTSGCTREAEAFRDASKKLAARGAVVVGVSRDSIASHCKFRDKLGLDFPLLSDPDGRVTRAYGAWGTKTMYGKKTEGVVRSTFVIGPDGRIRKIFRNVKVDGHVDDVLAALSPSKGT